MHQHEAATSVDLVENESLPKRVVDHDQSILVDQWLSPGSCTLTGRDHSMYTVEDIYFEAGVRNNSTITIHPNDCLDVLEVLLLIRVDKYSVTTNEKVLPTPLDLIWYE